ncbi:PH domain-containing protein [Mycobacterium sp. IDR2000157661]|uniref:PH domain-containing protein n=1 Tax=Mycobacterium sp. IDR2000157661 TaxID=2867005 RepID=UPI001EEDC568|nr:PH domain-containing protein [Mycobacterium sp. IDR2000157661]ULE35532.1 PH domain-containing protein [Mycobacterium sp. IDR2000157661]
MLLVQPVHEVLRQIPVIVGTLVLGAATGNPLVAVAALAVTVAVGLARWFTTSYRIGPADVQMRTGLLQRKVLSLPRNRIRSVSTDARLLHRLLGLTVLRVSTGQEARADAAFALDGVPADQVPHLRAVLLAGSLAVDETEPATAGRVLARWRPSWLRYSALSFTGLAMIAAAVGLLYQVGGGVALRDSPLAESGVDTVERIGVAASVALAAVVLVLASALLSVLQSLLTYGNLDLRRDFDVLHLRHGLVRVREHTYDMRRLRGGTLREPLLVRLFGGARLDAVMTGVAGAGEASVLLPPCPKSTAEAVLSDLIDQPDAVSGPVRGHGAAATRRRWVRALAVPVLAVVPLALGSVPAWAWAGWVVVTLCCALLAADRARSLGHRVLDGWLVTRTGSLQRRRDCIAGTGIIGWTVRQTLMQRRAGVATLIAATAAGVKRYQVIDVPAELAWSIAADASPWVGDTRWASDLR